MCRAVPLLGLQSLGINLLLSLVVPDSFGIPLYLSGPQNRAFAVAHAVNVVFELFIRVDRHLEELRVFAQGGILITIAPLSVSSPARP